MQILVPKIYVALLATQVVFPNKNFKFSPKRNYANAIYFFCMVLLSNSNLRLNPQLLFVLHAPTVHSQNATFFTPQCYTLFAAYLYQNHELALPGNLQSSKLLPSHHRNSNKRNASDYIPLPLVPSYSLSLSLSLSFLFRFVSRSSEQVSI